MKSYLPLFIFLLLAIFLYVALGIDSRKLPSPLIGKPFPTLTLADFTSTKAIDGKKIFNGQPALVNVWASWCTTCLAEHQTLLDISKQNRIKLIGVNYKDKKYDARQFLARYGNPFTQIIFDHEGKLGLELGVYATPETFLVNQDGIIVKKHIGEITIPIIKNWLKALN